MTCAMSCKYLEYLIHEIEKTPRVRSKTVNRHLEYRKYNYTIVYNTPPVRRKSVNRRLEYRIVLVSYKNPTGAPKDCQRTSGVSYNYSVL
eukprot:jgi/Botrbrau1/10640/Bobra.154_1s0029.1